MGGPGSARWRNYKPKPLVEESLRIDLLDPELRSVLHQPGEAISTTTFTVRGRSRSAWLLHFSPTGDDGSRELALLPTDDLSEKAAQRFQLKPLRVGFNERIHAVCPRCNKTHGCCSPFPTRGCSGARGAPALSTARPARKTSAWTESSSGFELATSRSSMSTACEGDAQDAGVCRGPLTARGLRRWCKSECVNSGSSWGWRSDQGSGALSSALEKQTTQPSVAAEGRGERPDMLKIQVSTPEMKALAESVRSMAVDPMTALQTLAGDIRGRFEDWTNELMQAELSLYLGREPYERSAKSPKNHGNGYRSRRDFAAVEFGDSSHRLDTPGHKPDTRTQNEGRHGGGTLH